MHTIVLRATLILTFYSASLTITSASAAQQLKPCKSGGDSDYIRLSTPVVKAWEQIPVGSPVYALDDAAGTKGWLNDHHLKGGGLTLRLKVACLRLKPLEIFPAESRLKARSAL
jgi:hypothetical protein